MDEKLSAIGKESQINKLMEVSSNFNGMTVPKIPSLYDSNVFQNKMPYMVDSKNNILQDYFKKSQEYQEKSQEYQEKSLEILSAINDNTANLYSLVELINKSNEKQEEMIEIIQEILRIAKAKNQEEAESAFKQATKRIHESVEKVDSMVKLYGWASMVFNLVAKLLC